jgi:hypothetical protein
VELVLVERRLVPPVAFDLSTYTEKSARKAFRFDLAGIIELYTKLRHPRVIITKARYRTTGLDPLGLVLRRLVYPTRLIAMTFGLSTLGDGHALNLSQRDRPARNKFGGLIYSSAEFRVTGSHENWPINALPASTGRHRVLAVVDPVRPTRAGSS